MLYDIKDSYQYTLHFTLWSNLTFWFDFWDLITIPVLSALLPQRPHLKHLSFETAIVFLLSPLHPAAMQHCHHLLLKFTLEAHRSMTLSRQIRVIAFSEVSKGRCMLLCNKTNFLTDGRLRRWRALKIIWNFNVVLLPTATPDVFRCENRQGGVLFCLQTTAFDAVLTPWVTYHK